jgi:transcriptional regulator with XRE-family HTH domain
MMLLKDVVFNYRKKHKISQREFAKQAGLSNSLISIIENGVNPQTNRKMKQTLDTYRRIANVMGISVHELFEQLDDDEVVDLVPPSMERIIPDSDLFIKLLHNMAPDDFTTVTSILEKTELNMKAKGLL